MPGVWVEASTVRLAMLALSSSLTVTFTGSPPKPSALPVRVAPGVRAAASPPSSAEAVGLPFTTRGSAISSTPMASLATAVRAALLPPRTALEV